MYYIPLQAVVATQYCFARLRGKYPCIMRPSGMTFAVSEEVIYSVGNATMRLRCVGPASLLLSNSLRVNTIIIVG